MKLQKEQDGISIVADWDFRSQMLAQYAPLYNTVSAFHAKIYCNALKKSAEKVVMNVYRTGNNGGFSFGAIDFQTDEVVFFEGKRDTHWQELSAKESLAAVFNRGELSFDKLLEYRFDVCRAMRLKLLNSAQENTQENVQQTAKTIGQSTAQAFENLYEILYETAYAFPLRGENDLLDLSTAKQVKYLSDAAAYAMQKTEFATTQTGMEFLYLEKQTLDLLFQMLLQSEQVKANSALSLFVRGAQACLNALGEYYTGDLGKYKGKTYKIEYTFQGNYIKNGWEYRCENFNYSISEGTNKITFQIQNGAFFGVTVNGIAVA
jgi:hypothetical protein